MLDIKLFRENPEIIRESEKKRFRDVKKVDQVIELDNKWREKKKEIDALKRERNQISNDINALKKKDKSADVSTFQERVKAIKELIEQDEQEVITLEQERDKLRYTIGNIIDKSVPIGQTEEADAVVRTWGKPRSFSFTPKAHADLVELIDGVEIDKAAEVSGARTYYLKNDLVFMNFAIAQFVLNFLVSEKGFTPYWTPYFLRKEIMRGASELSDLDEQLYQDPNEGVYFIATSEQTLAALHWNEIIETDRLPLKYTGFSACFRREAGAHGKDTKGIFRVHQFDKVEQFIYCNPEDSLKIHEELITNAETIFQRLEIPYRVVNIASGELNDNAAKKYDIVAWFPAQNTYREVVSCSNCTDFQARKLNIRVGRAGAEKEFLHTLNSTAVATTRAICAILENFQEEDGTVKIPKVLQPYMGGKTEIKPKK